MQFYDNFSHIEFRQATSVEYYNQNYSQSKIGLDSVLENSEIVSFGHSVFPRKQDAVVVDLMG